MQQVSRTEEDRTGYGARRTSPIGLGGTIVVHAVVIGAFLLMPKEMIDRFIPTGTLKIHAVPLDPPPPPPNQTIEKTKQTQTQKPIDRPYVPPVAKDLGTDTLITTGDPIDPGTLGGSGDGTTILPVDPPHAAILVDPLTDPRFARDFQPAYPPSMQRAQEEGKVTVRVRIGTDGRVIGIEKLFATNAIFWEATQEQALRKWRFRPATRDGQPVEGVRIMTLHFQIGDNG